MDINFIADPNLIPKPRPDIKVEGINAELLPGGQRFRIELRITPFGPGDRPNVTVEVFNPRGDSMGSTAVVETMHNNVSMIFHLREESPLPGTYRIWAGLYFDEEAVQGISEIEFDLPGQES